MISWLAAFLLVAGVINLFRLFGLVEKSRRIFPIVLQSLGAIQNPSLCDESKEIVLKKNAIRIFSLFFQLVFSGAAALLIPYAILWLTARMELLSFDSVEKITLSPAFLTGSFFFVICFFGLTSSSKRPSPSKYSVLDRISHQLAFNTALAQISIADLEDRFLAKRLNPVETDKPVFITAMPRAGTTLLLGCLANHPEFASHCYRDMPFLLMPCFWSRFSSLFRKKNVSRERAHGDGMLINFDSPEALEELIWKTFWYGKYQKNRILLWEEERQEEFEKFFRSHIRKIIYLRGGGENGCVRYVSKNNLNISRILLLNCMFPSSTILVPFRNPLQHCASMLRQHQNFLQIHKEDSFAAVYMKAIGHFDFGENLRPVDFNGWCHNCDPQSALALPFWLRYWNACYGWILNNCSDLVSFVDYEALCANPKESFLSLAKILGIKDVDAFLTSSKDIHPVRRHEVDFAAVPEKELQESLDLYTHLQKYSLNSSY